MKLFSIIFVGLLFSGTAHAQFGEFLKGLKNITDTLQNELGNVNDSQKKAADTFPIATKSAIAIPSAEEYCRRFTNSPSVSALSQAMDSLNNPIAVLKSEHTYLDNANGDLEKWVASKLALLPNRRETMERAMEKPMPTVTPEIEENVINSMIESVNKCALTTDKTLVGARLKTNFTESTILPTFLDKGGIKLYEASGGKRMPGITSAYSNRNPREATLMAFFFDGAEEEIMKISPNPVASFDQAAAKIAQRQKALAEAKKAEAEKEARANKSRAEANAFAASPDGKLVRSYQHFQIVQLCHDIRKDYAIQFVNSTEMSDLKNKMKQIESKFKNLIQDGSTDRIWEQAEKNNRNFGSTEIDGIMIRGIDLITTITNNNKANWTSAKGDCDLQVWAFREMVKDVLGNEPLKKSF